MKEFIQLIIGNQSLAMFAALFFFAMIGLSINLLIHASNRDQNSQGTPIAFSFKFLLWDNWKRIALVILLIYASIRFAALFLNVDTGNKELYLFGALLIGLIYDKLAQAWKEKADLLKVRK